ncbi:hypothetical protein DW049_05770 [Ruminococcus sp. AF41-9]|nr:hypothetical protein DW049_05770 [Ruminococcus sp. AF41-9]
MTNKKFMKKIAPVVMSAAVVMSSMPYAVMAADFTDSETVTDSAEVISDEFVSDDAQEEFTAQEPEEFITDSATAETKQGEAYVLMNIPYDDFYKAELKNNDVKVDAFTSATKNKSRTAGMMNGNSAYHVNPDGSDVTGVTFPVKVSDLSALKDQKQVTDSDSVTITVTNRGQTSSNTYTGKDTLIENASYAYYILSETPSYYKELTVNADGSYSFSAMKGAEIKTVTIDASLKTETRYGDYELDLNNEAFSEIIDTTTDKIYGVTVNTTDGTNYGLRHLENIWRGSMLSWGTGYTTEVHGCPVSSEHYKSIMGKTIESVTYYTDKGMITFDVPDVKVEITTGIKATVADIMDTDSEVAVTFDQALPSDFQAQYTVDGKEAAYANGKLTTGSLALGAHKVVITDISGTYAPIVTEFTVNTDKLPAAYNIGTGKIVAADDATAEDLAAYIKSISKVKVGETEYAASGRGAKVIVKEDGSLDLTDLQVTEGTVFEVTATGYKNNLVFTYEEAKFSLDVTEKTLYVKGKDTVTLKADTNLSDKITWSSSNKKVATVNSKGVVTAKAKGTAVITAICGEYKATCKVSVKTPTLKLAKTSASIKVGKKTTIKATATPTGTVKYTSSNKKIATVSSKGVVTGKKKGTAKITVTCNGVSKTFKVTVK